MSTTSDLAYQMRRAMGTPSPGSMGDYPPCNCGHSSPRHHGDDRSGHHAVLSSHCKDCSWCDRYMPAMPQTEAYKAWEAARQNALVVDAQDED